MSPPIESPAELINKSAAIAEQAHAGQVDKAGKPYIEHPRAVAEYVHAYYANEHLTSAAWLHDVIEDCPEWPLERLIGEGIPAEVLTLVDAVTRMEGEEYLGEFIPRVIAAGPWAIRLKIADLAHNMDPSRAASQKPSRAKRYEEALRMLREALMKETD